LNWIYKPENIELMGLSTFPVTPAKAGAYGAIDPGFRRDDKEDGVSLLGVSFSCMQ
jgi:hypothetical protein